VVWFGLLFLVLLMLGAGAVVVTSRGYRNKNPGNLRPLSGGQKWVGQVGVDTQGSAAGYVIFDSFENGIRALARDIKTKTARGLNTIAKIIPVFAPATENNVYAYIAEVEKNAGIPRNQVLTEADLLPLVKAMARHELGRDAEGRYVYALIPEKDYVAGVARA
jgi:hypothetical protein